MTVSVRLDVTNPGQYFAACGLFELASRSSRCEVLARFASGAFEVETEETLPSLLARTCREGLQR
jgi:CRISPR-associated protein Csb3